MNILLINHYAGSPKHGMEYRPFYMAREWARTGHRVVVAAASYSHVRTTQPTVRGPYAREAIDGVEFVWCKTPSYRGNGMGRALNIATFLLRLRQWKQWLDIKPDVVIASSTYPADIGPSRRIAGMEQATLVWEVHDLWPLSPIELGGMSRANPFIIWMQIAENTACRCADVVVSMLPMAAAHLRDHGMASYKFAYVPNGIDPTEWTDDSRSALPRNHSEAIAAARSRGHIVVAYAGAHGLANDLDTLLDAAAMSRDEPITWLLVGSGPEKPALARRVVDERLGNVTLLDPVSKAAIPDLLRAMDVLYLGLKSEPLFRFGISPNKLMDYMMAGRPVVCAIAAGNDPVGEAGCGITVQPGNPDAIARAVRQLAVLSPEQRDGMGLRGRAYALERHTYPVLARKFIEAIQLHERRIAAR